MDAAAESARNAGSKHQIHPEFGEWARRGTRRWNPSCETKFSGAHGDREILFS